LLATISHELRTPIGTILTDSTNMLRTQEMNTSVRYRIEGIATEARRLNRLLADMLSLARIESGALQLTLEPVQVVDAVAAAAERLKRTAPDRTVEWDPKQAGVSVLADWDSLGQIFDNLLDNANRFAPPGTPIAVRVAQEAPGQITIRVVDRGTGVPAPMRERLFNRFVKGPSNAGDGTGLGLAITRGLVEAHAGSIALEDGQPGETTFRFTLPEYDKLSPTVATSQWEARPAMDKYFAELGPGAPVNSFRKLVDSNTASPDIQKTLVSEIAEEDGLNNPKYKDRTLSRDQLRLAVSAKMAELKIDAILYPQQRILVVPAGEVDQPERNGALSFGTGFPAVT